MAPWTRRSPLAPILLTVLALAACGGTGNDPPQAAFAEPHGIEPGPFTMFSDETAALDASASSDPDADALGFRWTVLARPGGGAPVIYEPTAARTTFAPGWQGRYVVMLTVSDGREEDIALRALQVGPTFMSWYNENPYLVDLLDPGRPRCTTVGSAFRAAGRRLTGVELVAPAWRLLPPAGSAATLSGADTDTPEFVPDVAGRYVLQWSTGYVNTDGGDYIDTSGTTVDAVPPRLPGTADAAPGGMEVALLAIRRSKRSDGFVRVEVDLRLRNPGTAALRDAPLHLWTDDATEVLPVGFRRVEVAPGDAGIVQRTHVYLLPAAWTPLLWEYEPLSSRPPPPPDVELPPPQRLLWCAST